MSHLPVIIGFGGVSPAGRSSFHHAYRRLVLDKINDNDAQDTLLGLATLMNVVSPEENGFLDARGETLQKNQVTDIYRQHILDNTLIRRIHPDWFDVNNVTFNKQANISPNQANTFTLKKRQLPTHVPEDWQVRELENNLVEVTTTAPLDLIFKDHQTALVQSAGQLPTGFKPGTLYQSRNHPRSLQMTVYSASDAVSSIGIPWDEIRSKLSPDEVAVYAGNSIGQLDDLGFGGLLKNPSIGKRTTSKLMPLGFGQMPGDFVNAYLLGNLGATGTWLGACATYLYNLRTAVADIRSGRRRMVLVGGSDAPILPEVIEGFRSMGALAEDHELLALDNLTRLTDVDYRRACRPFAMNCGFTMGESSQYSILCDDELAMELGATIHGAVPEVFVNADGYKKSISAPGIGNYITMGKAAALVKSMLGEESLQQRSFVQAHGTSTPQNRVTESHVINETAKAFGISHWPVAAIKSYLGHSQGVAGGDQLAISLGTWAYGYIPGIHTMDQLADDVNDSNLRFEKDDIEVGSQGIDSVLLNSKGFGGNNASAVLLGPHIANQMLEKKHGKDAFHRYMDKREGTLEKAAEYDKLSTEGKVNPTYLFGHNVLDGDDLEISSKEIRIPGYDQPVELETENPFSDMC